MKKLRLQVILLAFWLVIFFNLDHLSSYIDISSIAYLFVLGVVITALIAPRLTKIPLWVFLLISTTIIMAIKLLSGELGSISAIALGIIEVCTIAITSLLSFWISLTISKTEFDVDQIKIGRRDKLTDSTSVGQGFIYREVRRARNHQRPLALMAVSVDEKSIKVDVDRIVKEVQLAMIKQYKLSGLSRTLCDELEDCAIIVQNDEHFLVALPEAKPEEVPIIIERLRKKVSDQIGVEIKIGAATLPQDGYTFEGLAYRAIQEMKEDLEARSSIELDRLPAEHKVTTFR